MLIEFSVENFRSFRDKVTFSMEKGIGEENEDNIFNINNTELLRSAAIYGANASGKSNLMRAFTVTIMMVRNSNLIPVNGKWNGIVPFVFDEESKNKPSSFEFIFITNNIKYKYYFSADSSKIYEESLEAFYSQKPTLIFDRKNVNEYTFNSDKEILKSIEMKNTDNKLFLNTASTWNYGKTKDAFLWFMNSIDTYNDFTMISDQDLKSFSSNDNDLKNFTIKLLKEADIVIKDINVKYEEKDMDPSIALFLIPPIARSASMNKIKNVNIEVEHEVLQDNGKYKTYKLDFTDESSGTQIMFALSPFLKRAFDSHRVIIVDELEKSLHPTLVEYIIKIFNNPNINKANSQLIFTTHAVNLLDLDIFRRDQIWFTEKQFDSGVSDLYPLDDFSVRKMENIQKGYLNGRYGAIPFIKDNSNIWQE